jgi:WD40 repeat protein
MKNTELSIFTFSGGSALHGGGDGLRRVYMGSKRESCGPVFRNNTMFFKYFNFLFRKVFGLLVLTLLVCISCETGGTKPGETKPTIILPPDASGYLVFAGGSPFQRPLYIASIYGEEPVRITNNPEEFPQGLIYEYKVKDGFKIFYSLGPSIDQPIDICDNYLFCYNLLTGENTIILHDDLSDSLFSFGLFEPAPPGLDFLAFIGYEEGRRLYLLDLTTGDSLLLTEIEGTVSELKWSPDGEYILARVYSHSSGAFLILDALTGELIRSISANHCRDPIWASNSRYLAYGCEVDANDLIEVVDIMSGELIAQINPTTDRYSPIIPSCWIGDSLILCYGEKYELGSHPINKNVYVFDIRNNQIQQITYMAGNETRPIIGPGPGDSLMVFQHSHSLMIKSIWDDDENCRTIVPGSYWASRPIWVGEK